MAQFEFKITSDDAGEMAGLMDKLFGRHVGPAPAAVEEAEEEQPAPVKRAPGRPRKTAETVAPVEGPAPADEEPTAAATQDVEPEAPARTDVTLDMIKQVGSKAMGVIKAAGVSAIFKLHGGGAESFAALKPETYAAVYDALNEAIS